MSGSQHAAALATLLKDGDATLRSGGISQVTKLLSEIAPRRVPRAHRLFLAQIARRCGQPGFGLRLLTLLVRPVNGKPTATGPELAEYAILLQRYGAVREALDILAGLNEAKIPDVPLYRAFCHFNLWRYDLALPEIESFLRAAPTPYLELVGQVNLAAALITLDRHQEARELLLRCSTVATQGGHTRLLANCEELLGQAHIHLGEYGSAEAHLGQAAALLGSARVHDQLFVKKWQAVIAAAKSGRSQPLRDFRAESIARGEPEGARDADFYGLKFEFHQRYFDYLYFGTPSPFYRGRMCRVLNARPSQDHYVFGVPEARCLNLETGTIEGREVLAAGSKPHQLLEILMRDFYRPLNVGGIFSELFPGEYFNIFTSPHKVRQIEYRLRQEFKSAALPLDIANARGLRSVKLLEAFAMRIPLERAPVGVYEKRLRLLQSAFPAGQSFSAKDAQSVASLSPTEFKRLASRALHTGDLERFGAGKATVYLFKAA